MNQLKVVAGLLYWYAVANRLGQIEGRRVAELLVCGEAEAMRLVVGACQIDDRLSVRRGAVMVNALLMPTGKKPAPKAKTDKASSANVRQVFDHWMKATGRKRGKAQLTPGRARAISARLKEGYTVKQLCEAVDGCAGSAWHQGENDNNRRYDDLTLICRSGEKVEGFIDLNGSGDRGKAKGKTVQTTSYEPDDVYLADLLYSEKDPAAGLPKFTEVLRDASADAIERWLQPASDWYHLPVSQIREQIQGVSCD